MKRLVYTSTGSVLFKGEDLWDVDETIPVPIEKELPTSYMASKALGEQDSSGCQWR